MPTKMALEQSPESQNRSRKAQGAMGRALKQVEALPEAQAQTLIASDKDLDRDPEAGTA